MTSIIKPDNDLTTVVITVTKPSQLTLFDEAESQRRRDEGIELAGSRSSGWQDRAMYVIWGLPIGWKGIGEDIRKLVLESGAGAPHHANCWGSLSMYATKCGIIRRTGEMRNAKSVKSHASTYPVVERV